MRHETSLCIVLLLIPNILAVCLTVALLSTIYWATFNSSFFNISFHQFSVILFCTFYFDIIIKKEPLFVLFIKINMSYNEGYYHARGNEMGRKSIKENKTRFQLSRENAGFTREGAAATGI